MTAFDHEGNLHQGNPILRTGKPLGQAEAAVIMLHGRGASARDILMLVQELEHPDFAYLAPQASNHTWYPYSFLSPIEKNEPWLSSALELVGEVVRTASDAGIPAERTVLLGFSQGACLAAEFEARNPQRYGGLVSFSGGLIGPPGIEWGYEGSLEGTPVFLGCSDVDPHIPEERVRETEDVLANLGAEVTVKLYPGMGHTINRDELERALKIMNNLGEEK
jgi:phospholipase/carboxylesterase